MYETCYAMLTEHFNHKTQVQALTGVSFCILTHKTCRNYVALNNSDKFSVYLVFLSACFTQINALLLLLHCNWDSELKLHVNKDLQPKLLCPHPCSLLETRAHAHTLGLPQWQTWRMSHLACHICRAWLRWGQAHWCTDRVPPQFQF